MQQLNLIFESINNLISDFESISLNPIGVLIKVNDFLFVFFLFALMYQIGSLTLNLFFKKITYGFSQFTLRITLGFIVIGTVIYLLGAFGLLSELSIFILLVALSILSLKTVKSKKIRFNFNFKSINFNFLDIFIFVFIVIGLLRLIPPQTSGDSLDYHLRFPRIYLHEKTMMITPKGDESYTTIPHLPEMLYIPSEIINNGEPSRIIHYAFFLVIVLLLYLKNPIFPSNDIARRITVLLFASAPLVLENSTAAFSDMPSLLCLLLSAFFILDKNLSNKKLILAGLLFGGALASKIWTLYFIPLYSFLIIFNLPRKNIKSKIFGLFFFYFFSLAIVLPWYLRGLILVGNPLNINDQQGREVESVSLVSHIFRRYTLSGFLEKFTFGSDFGYVFYIGIFFTLLNLRNFLKSFGKVSIFYILASVINAILLPILFMSGRYALPYIIPIFSVASYGLAIMYRNIYGRIVVLLMFFALSFYFLINTVIILPYGLGWANQRNYIKRNLLINKYSYYDFSGNFNKYFDKDNTIITYGMSHLYYAPFLYKNAYYFFDFKSNILKIPSSYNKILIRGGDFGWFCKETNTLNCEDYEVKLIINDDQAKLYLYNIEKNR